jgi:hypothetical protein
LPVCILRWVLAHASAQNVNVGKHNIGRVGYQRVPLRTVPELQVLDTSAMETNGTEQDWAQDVNVLRIQVIPSLSVAVKSSTSVDVHIMTTKLEESGSVLKGLVETILLPIIGIVRELNSALDVFGIILACMSLTSE